MALMHGNSDLPTESSWKKYVTNWFFSAHLTICNIAFVMFRCKLREITSKRQMKPNIHTLVHVAKSWSFLLSPSSSVFFFYQLFSCCRCVVIVLCFLHELHVIYKLDRDFQNCTYILHPSFFHRFFPSSLLPFIPFSLPPFVHKVKEPK